MLQNTYVLREQLTRVHDMHFSHDDSNNFLYKISWGGY